MTDRAVARQVLAGLALLLGIGAAVAGSSRQATSGTINVTALARDIEREADHVTALELAQWIRDRKAGLRVLDVRSDSEYADYHIPNAEHVPLNALATMTPRAHETLVLYSEGGAHAAQGWVLLRALGFRQVFFLRGGLLDWMDDVMSPMRSEPLECEREPVAVAQRTLRKGICTSSDSAWAHQAALSRYFGGVPRVGAAPLPAGATDGTGPATAARAVAKLKRRGC